GGALVGRGLVQHRPLASVDGDRSKLARMIDAQDLGQARGAGALARPWRDGFRRHGRSLRAASRLKTVSFSEIKAFQPAMESPRNTQGASSQEGALIGAPPSRAAMSAALGGRPVAAQASGPGQNFHSA